MVTVGLFENGPGGQSVQPTPSVSAGQPPPAAPSPGSSSDILGGTTPGMNRNEQRAPRTLEERDGAKMPTDQIYRDFRFLVGKKIEKSPGQPWTLELANAELARSNLAPMTEEEHRPLAQNISDFNPMPKSLDRYDDIRIPRDIDPLIKKNLEAVNVQSKEFYYAGEFSLRQANSLTYEMNAADSKLGELIKKHGIETGRSIFKTENERDLRRVWGNEFDEKVAIGNKFLHETDKRARTKIANYLVNSTLGNSSSLALLMYGQALIYEAKRGKF